MLRPGLERVEGFVDNIRYRSLTRWGVGSRSRSVAGACDPEGQGENPTNIALATPN
jgi:hypothetical protein